MSVFSGYAKYYDLLYRDKDYTGEAEFICSLLAKYAPDTKTILELGCGTGGHAECLVTHDYEVSGVDISEDMLTLANQRKAKLPLEFQERLTFEHGDVRSLETGKKYGAVISLFHVMSYQISNDDLCAAFRTARKHLNAGGVFVFDCWYGPGVLTDRPQVRVKRLNDDTISVLRIAEPKMYPNENRVDVNYQVWIKDKKANEIKELFEIHSMRYLFQPEIQWLLSVSGLELIGSAQFMGGALGFESWNACFVAKAMP